MPTIHNQHRCGGTPGQKLEPVSESHLGSFQHLPLVENLHGEYLVSVFHFYNCNLWEKRKASVTSVNHLCDSRAR